MDPQRLAVTPENFLEKYLKRLKDTANEKTYIAYQNNKEWTKVAIEIAEKVVKQDLGLQPHREFYKVDLIGYRSEEHTENESEYNWELNVAYEHENDDTWDGELCKLCHLAADLRVIQAYWDFRPGKVNKKGTIEDLLKQRIEYLGSRKIHRVSNTDWLFIFGPRLVAEEYPFVGFTVDADLRVSKVECDIEVIPQEWK